MGIRHLRRSEFPSKWGLCYAQTQASLKNENWAKITSYTEVYFRPKTSPANIYDSRWHRFDAEELDEGKSAGKFHHPFNKWKGIGGPQNWGQTGFYYQGIRQVQRSSVALASPQEKTSTSPPRDNVASGNGVTDTASTVSPHPCSAERV